MAVMLRKRGIFIGLLILTFIGSSLFAIFKPQQALAATESDIKSATLTWVNQATISAKVGSDSFTFFDSNIGDGTLEYAIQSYPCHGTITLSRVVQGRTATGPVIKNTGQLDMDYQSAPRADGTSDCSNTSPNRVSLPIGSTGNYDIKYIFASATQIKQADGRDPAFTQSSAYPNLFVAGSSQCADVILTNGGNATLYDLTGSQATRGPQYPDAPPEVHQSGCYVVSQSSIKLGGTASSPVVAPGSGGQSSTAAQGSDSCEARSGVLGWILCPAVLALDSGFSWIDTEIQALLEIDNTSYNNPGLHNAWAQIRNVAYLILVPVMLVMVIGTALGSGFFDAYTVKKALPRMVAAVIFISLSWYITVFLVQFFNVVGEGVLGLITAPFHTVVNGVDKTVSTLTLADLYSGATPLQSIITASALAIGAGVAIFFFAGTTFLFVALAFLVLFVRQLFVVALILASPLAILAWIFPGNDKIWKDWWNGFTKLLIMFPLIMGLIAVGRVFAVIIHDSSPAGLSGTLNPFFVLAAYTLPYAAIPLTFKFAGGLFATVAGAANDRSKGLFDRARERRTERIKRAQGQSLFNPNTGYGRFGNKMATWTTDPLSNLAYKYNKVPGLSGKGNKIRAQLFAARMEQSGNLYKELNESGMFNDKAYRALSGAYSGFKDPGVRDGLIKAGFMDEQGRTLKTAKSFDEITKVASILDKGGETERVAGNALRGYAGRISSLYSDPEMGKAGVEAAGIMGLAAHGFAEPEDIANVANNLVKSGADKEYAQAVASRAQVVGQQQRPDLKAGYGVVVNKDTGEFESIFADGNQGRQKDLIKTISSHDLAAAKTGALKRLSPVIQQMVQDGGNEAQAVEDQLFSWAGPYSQASVASKAEALDIIDTLSGARGADGRYAEGTIGSRFEQRRRAETDPTRRNEAGDVADGGGGEAH
ncbi:MAG TPA: hypothetical protein VLG25_02220 [Patescibacteria group bacterium]|nr:hypothetical protein [Patescibacteria group bacterium]